MKGHKIWLKCLSQVILEALHSDLEYKWDRVAKVDF